MYSSHYKIRFDQKKRRYRANVKNLDPASTSPQKTFYGKTETELRKMIDDYFYMYDTPKGKTVDAVAEQLFSIHNLHFAKSTRMNYEAIYAKYFAPNIGNKNIKKVSPDDIMHVLQECEKEGKTGKTINNVGCVIRAVFRFATEQHYIRESQDPTLKCRFPKKETVLQKSLSEAELEAIFSVLQADPYFTLYHFILLTGLRRNEALGLCWPNINLVANTITVKRQLMRIKGAYQLLPPKEYAQRTIKLSEDALALLKSIKEQQSIEANVGKWSNPQNLVFTNATGGHFVMETVNRHFKRAAEAAGVPDATIHALRHSFATRLYEATGNPELVREYLGHKDVATTMQYYCHPTKHSNGMSVLMAIAALPTFESLVNRHV